MSAPTWSESIRSLYLSGAANQFVLHGNIADRILLPGREEGSIGTLADFLAGEQLRRFDLVLSYELGSGIRVLAGEELLRRIAPAGEIPRDPAGAIGWLDHLLRLCVNLRALAPTTTSGDGLAGKNLHLAILVGGAELIFPVAKQVRDYALNSMASVVRSWSHETHFLEQNLAVFLLSEAGGPIHLKLEARVGELDAAIVPGVGLTSLRRRAEDLGGRFSITSHEPSGVHVHLELPLEAVA